MYALTWSLLPSNDDILRGVNSHSIKQWSAWQSPALPRLTRTGVAIALFAVAIIGVATPYLRSGATAKQPAPLLVDSAATRFAMQPGSADKLRVDNALAKQQAISPTATGSRGGSPMGPPPEKPLKPLAHLPATVPSFIPDSERDQTSTPFAAHPAPGRVFGGGAAKTPGLPLSPSVRLAQPATPAKTSADLRPLPPPEGVAALPIPDSVGSPTSPFRRVAPTARDSRDAAAVSPLTIN